MELKDLCQSLKKPSEATTRSLAKLFPGSLKRKFDPIKDCVNSESRRKKRAAISRCRGRPKQIPVVLLKSVLPSGIPKGTARDILRDEGRIKYVGFYRFFSWKEVKKAVNDAFPNFCIEFDFLQAIKGHTLSVAVKQELDGSGVIELAKHGSLYLLEKSDADVNSSTPKHSSSESPCDPVSKILCSLQFGVMSFIDFFYSRYCARQLLQILHLMFKLVIKI